MKRTAAFIMALAAAAGLSACRKPPAELDGLIPDIDGGYSDFSSTWGLGVTPDGTLLDAGDYEYRWRVSGGALRIWDAAALSAVPPPDEADGEPRTYSDDENGGGVIWSPEGPDGDAAVTLELTVYAKDEPDKPVARDTARIEKNGASYSVVS